MNSAVKVVGLERHLSYKETHSSERKEENDWTMNLGVGITLPVSDRIIPELYIHAFPSEKTPMAMVTLRHPLNPWVPEDLWKSLMFPQVPWVSPGYLGVAWEHPGNLRDLQRSSEIQGFRGCLRVTMAIGVFSDVHRLVTFDSSIWSVSWQMWI